MSKNTPVPVAVIGAGAMGENHVRVYDELPDSRLVEVVEPDPEQANRIREEYEVTVLDDIRDIEQARAVTIAAPTPLHREIAETCAEMGLDMLVEKPIAETVSDAQAITNVASEHGVELLVGHIEQFNPAIRALREILERETPIAIEAHRLGPFNQSLRERNVVFDLMIHDLDIVRSLVNAEISAVGGVGTIDRSENAERSDSLDHAIAHLHHENGVLGSVTASHVTHGKIRTLNVTTQEAYISLDYQSQHIEIQRRGTEQTTSLLNRAGYRTETVTETPFVPNREPLKIEVEHFLACVRGEETAEVDGESATAAVSLATEVVESIQ